MQTASQIIAAKRKAKQAKKTVKLKTISDRNDIAVNRHKQKVFVMNMQIGRPCSKEANINDEIRNLLHYGVLVYEYDSTSVTVFEKLIRAMRIVAAIYEDQVLARVCKQAEEALTAIGSNDSSPNQRRVMLKPLLLLSGMAAQYGEIVPEQTTGIIAKYCAAVQANLYCVSLYERPLCQIEAMNAVIRGDSLRALAKKYGQKENALRQDILDCAWHLFRIAECFTDVSEPKSIPDLRRPEWLDFGNPVKLKGMLKAIIREWLIPFESATGITMLNYRDFKEKIEKISAG